ncbi:hypothetical protein D3C78_505700 [compost metagenome]
MPVMVGVLSLVSPFCGTGPVTLAALSSTETIVGVCAGVMSGAVAFAVGPVFPALSAASAVRVSPFSFGGAIVTLKLP